MSSSIASAVHNSVFWGGFRVWQRNRDAFLRAWRVEVGGIAIEPFIMLTAIGFGLGAFVDDIGDLSYAEFLAPGVVASYAMFHATLARIHRRTPMDGVRKAEGGVRELQGK